MDESYAKDARVDGYINALPEWQQQICHQVRDLVHGADPEGIITAGHGNKTGRQVSYRRGDEVNERALVALFRAIIANNRAGGWRKLKRGAASAT